MKKCLSVLLCLSLLAGSLFLLGTGAAAQEEDGFVPVLRFIASSDTHVRDDSDVTAGRIGKMLALGYAAADGDPDHNTLDALLICGDLTNDGTKTEFDKFWAAVSGSKRSETQFLGVVAKNHDGYEMPRKEMRGYYTSLTGNDPDFHTVICGYHFIGVSASAHDGQHYDLGQLKWLKQQLDEAVADAPDRPVFVMHHEHNRGTVYGSSWYDGWGVTYFKSILNRYPQVVDFSGHSHYPINDPRSVWQGAYTAMGTGAIYYSEFTIDEVRAYDPPDAFDTATCWIVELDAENNMRLTGMDVEEGKVLCRYVLKNPADPANREYTPAKQKAASRAPVFGDDAEISVTPVFGGCTVKVSAAASTDGTPVVLYRFSAVDKYGVTQASDWLLPSYYRAIEQDAFELTLEGLAAGEYTVRVTAETAYGVKSEPIEAKVTVEGNSLLRNLPERIRLFFARLAYIIKEMF